MRSSVGGRCGDGPFRFMRGDEFHRGRAGLYVFSSPRFYGRDASSVGGRRELSRAPELFPALIVARYVSARFHNIVPPSSITRWLSIVLAITAYTPFPLAGQSPQGWRRRLFYLDVISNLIPTTLAPCCITLKL